MTDAAQSTFIYVTFIRTTPQKLWDALTAPEFTKAYWFGMHQESDWKPGSPWRLVFPDGRVADAGEVLEADPPRRMVIKWGHEWRPEIKAEGPGVCVYELEAVDDVVKLTVTHTSNQPGSKLIEAVSGGWPKILSNLKSLLETGAVIMEFKP